MKQYVFLLSVLFLGFTGFGQPVVLTGTGSTTISGPGPDGTGPYELKYNARTLLEGAMQSGRPNGIWKHYDQDGNLMIRASFANGQRDGEWKYYNSEGRVVSVQKYTLGEPSGVWVSSNEYRKKRMVLSYELPNRPSEAVWYYPSEDIAQYTEYRYESGDTLRIDSYYYPSTNIFAYRTRKNGVLDGSLILYHKRGGKFEDLVYDNGKLDRVNGLYTYTGQRLKVGSFADGSGKLFRYYPNGLLFAEEQYTSGKRQDTAVYYDNKIPTAKGAFNAGEPVGLWAIKSWDRVVDRYYVFDSIPGLDFVVVGKNFDYGERVEGFMRDGEPDGTWTSYNTYNEPTEIMNYRNGVPHGWYYKYLGASKLEEGEFKYGQRYGVWNYYNMSSQLDFKEVFQSQVTFDSTWHEAPEPGYRLVFDGVLSPEHGDPYQPLRVKEWIADLPGTELIKTFSSPYRIEPDWILVKRDIPLVEAPDWQSAKFEGGANAKINFFRQNTILDSEILKGDTIHGLVMVRFKVDAFGFLSDFKIVKGMGYGVDEAVLETYKKMPAWRPAHIEGIRVDSYRVEAIYF